MKIVTWSFQRKQRRPLLPGTSPPSARGRARVSMAAHQARQCFRSHRSSARYSAVQSVLTALLCHARYCRWSEACGGYRARVRFSVQPIVHPPVVDSLCWIVNNERHCLLATMLNRSVRVARRGRRPASKRHFVAQHTKRFAMLSLEKSSLACLAENNTSESAHDPAVTLFWQPSASRARQEALAHRGL